MSATKGFGQNRRHRSDTASIVFNSFPLSVTHLIAEEPSRDRRRVASPLFRDCTAVVGPTAEARGDVGVTAIHDGAAATPLRIGHCGSFEHVQSFRRATAKVRCFDSFPRCYSDQ